MVPSNRAWTARSVRFPTAIALARMPQMLDDRVPADPEDLRNLPVRFPACGPDHALALPVRQRHGGDWTVRVTHSPRGFERKGANELQQRQMLVVKTLSSGACEWNKSRALRPEHGPEP